jgi:hypothetical protein
MSNPKPPAKPKGPIPEPLPEPPELAAKRDGIIAGLEKASKNYAGSLQQVLRKSAQLMVNTRPEGQIDTQLYQDVKDAFQRYANDTAAPAAPPALMEFLDWLQAYVAARPPTLPVEGAAAAAPAPTPAAAPASAPAAAPRVGGRSDGFESSSPGKRASLVTGEAPPPPSQPMDPKSEAKQLESFKAWMKNPSFGKTKG